MMMTTSALLMMTISLQGLPTVSADTWQLDLGNLSLQPAGGTSVKTVQPIEVSEEDLTLLSHCIA